MQACALTCNNVGADACATLQSPDPINTIRTQSCQSKLIVINVYDQVDQLLGGPRAARPAPWFLQEDYMSLNSETSVRVIGHQLAADGESHCEYIIRVEVSNSDGEPPALLCETRRRYSQFRFLHEDLFHLVGGDLPAQRKLVNTTAAIEERTQLLDAYLKRLLALALQAPAVPAALARFLEIPGAQTPGSDDVQHDRWASGDLVPAGTAAGTEAVPLSPRSVVDAVKHGALHGFSLPEMAATVVVIGWGKTDANKNTLYELLLTLAPRDGGRHHHVFNELHSAGKYGLRVKRHYDHLEWLDRRLRADERLRRRMEAHMICLPREGRPRRPTDPSSWFTPRPDAAARAPALRSYLQVPSGRWD